MPIAERPQRPIAPVPLHNRDGTLRSLARQMLHDLDPDSLNTTVPTAQLAVLLEALCDALDRPPRALVQNAPGELIETTANPNLRYWVKRANQEVDDADDAGEIRPLPLPQG